MDATQKLMQFMEAVNRSTEAKVALAEKEADKEAEAYLREAQEQCEAEALRTVAAAKSKITAKYQKQTAQVGYQGKTTLQNLRQTLLMELFQDLREQLKAFAASEEYLPWMRKVLEKHQPEANAVILIREADTAFQAQLAEVIKAEVTFRTDPAILIGGVSILSADGRRCSNHTLDDAYAGQLRNFYRNHKIDGGDR
ncbi:MAG: V-type proton ATPase subunit E [Oscillospiraceae bacterium]|nr:V-type proton ATPase subunit E [Oscillospiraceae bacterium]